MATGIPGPAMINLNPGADATLVNAAYRAAMANVPKDLSGTFEALATNYAQTMQVIGQAWSGVAKIGGKLMGEATNNFIEGRKMEALGSLYQNEDGVKFLLDGSDYTDPQTGEVTHINGLRDIKQQLWDTWKNDPFSEESRGKRIKLRQDKDRLYAQIDELSIGYGNVADTLASKNYSEGAMNSNNGEARLLAAIGAMRSSRGTAENGDYVKAGHDKYGDLILTLFDKDDNAIKVDASDPTSQNLSIRSTDLNKMIITKVPQSKSNFYKFTDDMRAMGAKTGTKWENSKTRYMANIESTVGDENALHYMMHEKRLYNQEASFADDLAPSDPGGSVTSANIFGMMGNTLPTDKNGNPIPIDDTNKDGVINSTDFTSGAAGATNYAKIVSALTNRRNKYYDADVSKETFLNWAEQQGKSAFDYGTTFRKTSTENNDRLAIKNYEWIGFGGKNQSGNVALKVLNDMSTGEVTDPRSNDIYTWNKDGWYSGGKMVAKNNDALARDVLEVRDQRFYGIPNPTSTTDPTTPISKPPADFDKAFRDDEDTVVQFFKNNPNLYPGMKVERTTKDDPEDGNDTFRVTMPDGTSKVFTADPLIGDKKKIKEAWDWINNNYVNNEFAE